MPNPEVPRESRESWGGWALKWMKRALYISGGLTLLSHLGVFRNLSLLGPTGENIGGALDIMGGASGGFIGTGARRFWEALGGTRGALDFTAKAAADKKSAEAAKKLSEEMFKKGYGHGEGAINWVSEGLSNLWQQITKKSAGPPAPPSP